MKVLQNLYYLDILKHLHDAADSPEYTSLENLNISRVVNLNILMSGMLTRSEKSAEVRSLENLENVSLIDTLTSADFGGSRQSGECIFYKVLTEFCKSRGVCRIWRAKRICCTIRIWKIWWIYSLQNLEGLENQTTLHYLLRSQSQKILSGLDSKDSVDPLSENSKGSV